MTALMRIRLEQATRITRSAHAGLLLNRGLTAGEADGPKPLKAALIKKISQINPCELYKKAFDRWVAATTKSEQFSFIAAKIEGRLFIGLATGGAIETGVSTQHSYGMPFIAGSAIKGAVRSYTESINLGKEYQAVLFGSDDVLAKEANSIESAGCLVWHDAWWVPEGNQSPFVAEIVTVHHQDYYSSSNSQATDFDSPVPNQQLAVQGSFYFVIEGEVQWTSFAKQLLINALAEQGLGGKTAAGYGFFNQNDKTQAFIKTIQATTLSPNDQIKSIILEFDEQQLAEAFGTKRAAFFAENNIQDAQKAIDFALEFHADIIDRWQQETKKTSKAKFKAYKYLMGENDDS